MVTIIATMFLPGLLLGIGSCWHKNMIKTIVAHPSVVLMPTFTNFTFQSRINWCNGKEKEGEQGEGKTEGDSNDPFIIFSPKFTIANIILSIIGNVVYSISMWYIAGWDALYELPVQYDGLPGLSEGRPMFFEGLPVYLSVYLFPWITIPTLSLLLTLFSLVFISKHSNIHCAVKYTLANLISNIAAYQIFLFVLIVLNGPVHFPWDQHIYFIPIPIFGVFVTFLKIILACYYDFTLPACFSIPRVEYGALVCSDPQAHYVLDAQGKPKVVLEDNEEKVNNQNKVHHTFASTDFVTELSLRMNASENGKVKLNHCNIASSRI